MKLTKTDLHYAKLRTDWIEQILKNQEDAEKWRENCNLAWYQDTSKNKEIVSRLKKRIEEVRGILIKSYPDGDYVSSPMAGHLMGLQKILGEDFPPRTGKAYTMVGEQK